jgi:hypothetical protein
MCAEHYPQHVEKVVVPESFSVPFIATVRLATQI